MSLRTFTVFQDTPSADVARPKAPIVTSPTLSTKPLNANCATTTEKENVDPLTGERAGPTITNGKKRKTSVLTAKKHAPLTSKKQKESTEPPDSNMDAKKRKSSASSALKLKTVVKKDGKTSSSRKTAKKPSRRVSPMLPKVDEEAEAERVRERITQADIDSRCYELTVKPLADLSQAYEQGPCLQAPAIDDNGVKFRSVKESSAEPELRDYFSQSATLPLGSDGTSTLDSRTFSTPERKQIYTAFTFTSPSRTHERLSRASSFDSVQRLELV